MKVYYRLFALLFLVSCVDQLDFSFRNDSNYLIVDGFITNLAREHQIRLFYSAPFQDVFDGGTEDPISNASVRIVDDLGNFWPLLEGNKAGAYQTALFQGEIGRAYQLNITLPNGEEYESKWERIPVGGTVDQLYFDQTTRTFLDSGIVKIEKGLEFFIDASYNANHPYYMVDWEGTYTLPTLVPKDMIPVPDTCYVTDKVGGVVEVISTLGTSSASTTQFPIYFTSIDRRFLHRYSMSASLYAMEEDAYEFHRLIQEQIGTTGTVFDPLPVAINGNMTNINNPEEKVLGYFGAYHESEKRVFLTKEDLFPTIIDDRLPDICTPANELDTLLNWCNDCRMWPISSEVKPSFWN